MLKSEIVFRAAYEVILAVQIELVEVGGVASNSHNKIPVGFGVCLRCTHGVRGNYVVLNLHAAQIHISLSHGAELCKSVFGAESGGVDADVEGETVHKLTVIKAKGAFQHGKRTVAVATLSRYFL